MWWIVEKRWRSREVVESRTESGISRVTPAVLYRLVNLVEIYGYSSTSLEIYLNNNNPFKLLLRTIN